jgi:hypothetical protein
MWVNLRGRLALVRQTESRGGTVSRGAQRLRHAFIVGQVALAFVLLVGASLLGLSLQRVLAVSPGFQPDHVLTGQLVLPWNNYREPASRLAFLERLLDELRAQPGVTYAGINTAMPISGNGDNNATVLAGIFAAAALLLASIGTYGVLAYSVAQQRREIGVRLALGAQRAHIHGRFLGVGARLLAVGLAFGGFGAWGVGRAMKSVLFEVGAMHAGVLVATVGVMMIVVLLACWLPARRAANIDPMEALRCE